MKRKRNIKIHYKYQYNGQPNENKLFTNLFDGELTSTRPCLSPFLNYLLHTYLKDYYYLADVQPIPLARLVSFKTNGSWIGWPSSVIAGALTNLPLPTRGNNWRHSSFHVAYCILMGEKKWYSSKEFHKLW